MKRWNTNQKHQCRDQQEAEQAAEMRSLQADLERWNEIQAYQAKHGLQFGKPVDELLPPDADSDDCTNEDT